MSENVVRVLGVFCWGLCFAALLVWVLIMMGDGKKEEVKGA